MDRTLEKVYDLYNEAYDHQIFKHIQEAVEKALGQGNEMPLKRHAVLKVMVSACYQQCGIDSYPTAFLEIMRWAHENLSVADYYILRDYILSFDVDNPAQWCWLVREVK